MPTRPVFLPALVAILLPLALPAPSRGAGTPQGSCASTQELLNGDFELGIDPGVYRTQYPGSTDITDWSVGDTGAVNPIGSSSVDYYGTLWADHTTGSGRSLDMSGLAPGMVFQSFATVIDQVYDVSFWMNGNSDGPPDPKELLVSAGDVSLLRFLSPSAYLPWVQKTFSLTATAAVTTLIFEVPTELGVGPGSELGKSIARLRAALDASSEPPRD